jgi:hypothetical protein
MVRFEHVEYQASNRWHGRSEGLKMETAHCRMRARPGNSGTAKKELAVDTSRGNRIGCPPNDRRGPNAHVEAILALPEFCRNQSSSIVLSHALTSTGASR